MAEPMTAFITWHGRVDGGSAPVHLPSISTCDEEDMRDIFSRMVSEGLVSKNDGFYLGVLTPKMTPEDLRYFDSQATLPDDSEEKAAIVQRMVDIVEGNDEVYSVEHILESYATSLGDWLPEALEVTYDNEKTDSDVTYRG